MIGFIYQFYDNPLIFYNLINIFVLFSLVHYQILERLVNNFLVDEYIKNDINHLDNCESWFEDDNECVFEKITKDKPVEIENDY